MAFHPLDPLDTAALSPLLQTRWLGRRLARHEELRSTNSEAARLAGEGAEHGCVVIADHQTQGRGRRGRTWHSPPGQNLYFSMLLRPDLEPSAAPPLSLATAVGVAQALTELLPHPPLLKWPNDLLCGGKKLCGILVQMNATAAGIQHVIVGVGLNVNVTEFPAKLQQQATSLRLERGEALRRTEVLAALLTALEPWFERLIQSGPEPVIQAWERRSGWLGRAVTLTRSDGSVVQGVAHGLDRSGGLRLRLDDGSQELVLAGDLRDRG